MPFGYVGGRDESGVEAERRAQDHCKNSQKSEPRPQEVVNPVCQYPGNTEKT